MVTVVNRAPPPELLALLNQLEPGQRAVLHCVPTRIIRVVCDQEYRTFKVQQLRQSGLAANNETKAQWITLSTHLGDKPGESYGVACTEAHAAQKKLIAMLQEQAKAAVAAMPTTRIKQ